MAAKTSPKEDLAAFLLVESLNKKEPLTSMQAMINAGYAVSTARVNCHKLTNHRIYKEWVEKQTDNAFSTKDAIEKRLFGWLTANINDFFDFVDGGISIKDLKSLPREITNCIESIKKNRGGIEIKLVSKVSAMDMLCKINGLFVTKIDGEIRHPVSVRFVHGTANLQPIEPKNRIKEHIN